MNTRRELFSGFFAALVSVAIIGGSFITSLAEGKMTLAQLPQAITSSPFPTSVIFTPRPGEPTLAPSLISPPEQEELPSPTSACPVPPGWVVITVNPGDTLESLATAYNISVDELVTANCLLLNTIPPGALLFVPARLESPTATAPQPTATACKPPWGWILYTIQPGDTLFSLAKAYGTTVAKLKTANCIVSDIIRAGEKIWVPNVPTITPTPSFVPTITPSSTTIPPTQTDPVSPTTTPTSTDTTVPTPTETETLVPTTAPTIPVPPTNAP